MSDQASGPGPLTSGPGPNESAIIDAAKSTSQPMVYKRWELWLSVIIWGITSAVQQDIIIGARNVKIAMWVVGLITQVAIIFGRPLLWRGVSQVVNTNVGR